ncbi:hypothetical protein ABZW18_31975 [Streptomyces sp. NPDC004647]|uniref:coiled-coil domain-containing protein n=1 Tax=Streptomyces sp. NPDC004647 TaxID=3154671 RepID=UPI0033A366A9
MSERFVRSVRAAVVAAGTALAVAAPPPQAVAVDPADRPISELLTELRTLYREAEEAGEAYNSTAQQLKVEESKAHRLGGELVTARTLLADARNDAGRLARDQYQGSAGTLSPYLRLLLSRRLQSALDEGHMIQQAAGRRMAVVIRLTRNEQRLDGLAGEAREVLDRRQTLTERKMRQRDAAQGELDEVERLLASLSQEQLTALDRLERSGGDDGQQGALPDDSGASGVPGVPALPDLLEDAAGDLGTGPGSAENPAT